MKLLVLSDIHLEQAHFKFRGVADFDAVVLAGDIGRGGDVARWARHDAGFEDKPIIFVAGNHEYYGGVLGHAQAGMRKLAAEYRVHFLECDQVVVSGVRFLGCTLWTDFALRIEDSADPSRPPLSDRLRSMNECGQFMSDYKCIRIEGSRTRDGTATRMLLPKDTLKIHQQACRWLLKRLAEPFDGPTVVVSHHAPHRKSLGRRFAFDWASGGFVSELRSAFFAVPTLWVHGHTHQSFDYKVGRCRVLCNPRGRRLWGEEFENRNFNPRMLVEIVR